MIFLSILLIGSLLSLTVLFTYFYFRYHQPSRTRMEADRLSLLDQLNRDAEGLKPWPPEVSALLSSLPYPSARKRGWKDQHSGVLKTILGESVVAWAYLHFKSNNPHYLLVFRISGEEQPFTLRIRDDRAFLFEGERHVATVEPEGNWMDPRSGKMIGHLRKHSQEERALLLGGHVVAIFLGVPKPDQTKPRLFTWLEPLTPVTVRWARIIGICWLIVRQERIPLAL